MPVTYSNVIFAEGGTWRQAGYYFCERSERINQIPDIWIHSNSNLHGPYNSYRKANDERNYYINFENGISNEPGYPPERDVLREYYYPENPKNLDILS